MHQEYLKGTYSDSTKFVPVNWVRVCLLLLKFYSTHCDAAGRPKDLTLTIRNAWSTLWPLSVRATKKCAAENGDISAETQSLALEGLAILDGMNRLVELAAKDAVYRVPFPQEVVVALVALVPDHEQLGPFSHLVDVEALD